MLKKILEIVVDVAVFAAVSGAAAWYYYIYRRRDLIGGFWAAAAVAFIGGVVISVLAGINSWFIHLVDWLMLPKFEEIFLFRVNLITAAAGAFLFVYVLNRINHDRERRR
ncbi:MAG: hypothetical protein K1X75_09225 [Leptospirales bacterium]|nr:hypothetical protein [Leptospirales bacterium]